MEPPTLETADVFVTWVAPRVSDEIWDKLAGFGPATLGSKAIGTILLSSQRVAHAGVWRDESDHWYLHVHPRPSSDPPSSVQDRTSRIGGAKGLRDLLVGKGTLPISGDYRIKLALAESDWRCLAVPMSLRAGDPCHQLDPEAKVEQVGYRLTGPNGLSEVVIIYGHKAKEYSLDLFGKGLFDPDQDLVLPYANELLTIGVRTFFREHHATTI
jgi:hypothetical protein